MELPESSGAACGNLFCRQIASDAAAGNAFPPLSTHLLLFWEKCTFGVVSSSDAEREHGRQRGGLTLPEIVSIKQSAAAAVCVCVLLSIYGSSFVHVYI